MKPRHKVALIAGGYIACLLVASAAVAIRIATTNSYDRQAAGGMYAFGDGVLFVAVFGVSALVPTGAALVLLRNHDIFWKLLSASGLAVALTGVAAAVLFAVGRHATKSPLAIWAGISVLRILSSPLLALSFIVCAVLSPRRLSRLAFCAAAALEAAVSAYGVYVWFLAQSLHGHD